MSTETEPRTISQETREHIRKVAADVVAATKDADARRARGEPVGNILKAANFEGSLGRFTLPLLDALEAAEQRIGPRDLVPARAEGPGVVTGQREHEALRRTRADLARYRRASRRIRRMPDNVKWWDIARNMLGQIDAGAGVAEAERQAIRDQGMEP